MNIDLVTRYAARATVISWYAGLAYYNWFAAHPLRAPFWWHVCLVTVGMLVAVVIVGGGVSLFLLAVSRLRIARNFRPYEIVAWSAVVSPVLTFFCAGYAL